MQKLVGGGGGWICPSCVLEGHSHLPHLGFMHSLIHSLIHLESEKFLGMWEESLEERRRSSCCCLSHGVWGDLTVGLLEESFGIHGGLWSFILQLDSFREMHHCLRLVPLMFYLYLAIKTNENLVCQIHFLCMCEILWLEWICDVCHGIFLYFSPILCMKLPLLDILILHAMLWCLICGYVQFAMVEFVNFQGFWATVCPSLVKIYGHSFWIFKKFRNWVRPKFCTHNLNIT